MNEGDVRLEAGDVLTAVLALLLLLGVRLPLVVSHREKVVEGDAAHLAVNRKQSLVIFTINKIKL